MTTLPSFVRLSMGLASLCMAASAVAGDTYPQRALTIVVPFPAGGPTDLLGRVVGSKLAEHLGQSVIIENRGGGNTVVAASAVARAKPDGYTLLLAIDNTLVMNQFLYSNLPYDPIKDFEPISKVAVSPLILVTGAEGPASVQSITDTARARPLSYGFGTITTQLGGELFKRSLQLDMLGVPYKGSSGTIQGLMSGDVDFAIDGVTAALPHIKAGKLRAVAALGKEDAPGLPTLPRLSDHPDLNGFDVSVWMALVAPKGVAPSTVDVLSKALAKVLAAPDVRDTLNAAGLIPESSTPDELRSFMHAEATRWAPVVEAAGMRIQ